MLVPLLAVSLVALLMVGGAVAWRVSSSGEGAADPDPVSVNANPATPSRPEAGDPPGVELPAVEVDGGDPDEVQEDPVGAAVAETDAVETSLADPAPTGSSSAPAPTSAAGEVSASAETAAASPVTAADFSAFVATHPEWSKVAATEAGKADSNYLRDWSDGAPPAGQRWAVNVSWNAASAYCAARGGLAGLVALPDSWPETGQPFQEWRQEVGRAAWRRFDGATSVAVRHADANAFTGFRCAR